jgi:hypothetical protein
MSESIVHVAGELDEDGIQHCVVCGELIRDDESVPPRGWEEGALVYHDGGNFWCKVEDEGATPRCEPPEMGDYSH